MERDGDWGESRDGSSEVLILLPLRSLKSATDAERTARLLVSALAKEKDVGIRSSLAAGLCRIAQRMESADAAKVCGPVIDNMAAALVAKQVTLTIFRMDSQSWRVACRQRTLLEPHTCSPTQ